jgi:hypothetical protein
MSGTGLAKALPMGASALGRIAEGGTAGALVGATTPITESADNPGFFKEKAMQTGLGALTGGVIPAIMETGKALGRVGGEIGDLFWTEGPSNIVTRYQRKIVGEQNVPAVQTALKNVQQYVEGSKPTAAEALVGTIEGSPIQSHQKFIASQPGGSSAAFGERVSANQQAREVAHDVTDGLMTERLHEIFDAANKKGGVKTPNIQYALFDVSKMPGIRNTPLERTFDSMRERIQGLSGKSLRADARDIYSVWKDLDKIAASSGTDVAKKNAVQAAQKVIDEVLEKSAGVKWVEFKSVHNAQMKNIAADIERFAEQYKPVQKTRLGGAKLEKGEIESLPHMLSRPLVIGNWALKILKGDIEPAVVAEASRRYLNPKDMARSLDLKPAMITPEVWESLVRSASVSGATAAAHAKYSKQGKEAAKAIGATP